MVQRAHKKGIDDDSSKVDKRRRKEGKSKQVIITHPSLIHCETHLGLIKTMEIGLVITGEQTNLFYAPNWAANADDLSAWDKTPEH